MSAKNDIKLHVGGVCVCVSVWCWGILIFAHSAVHDLRPLGGSGGDVGVWFIDCAPSYVPRVGRLFFSCICVCPKRLPSFAAGGRHVVGCVVICGVGQCVCAFFMSSTHSTHVTLLTICGTANTTMTLSHLESAPLGNQGRNVRIDDAGLSVACALYLSLIAQEINTVQFRFISGAAPPCQLCVCAAN